MRTAFHRITAIACGLVLAACETERPAPTDLDHARADEAIAPPSSRPLGRSYSQWAADWWIWALGTPASTNPILDATGEHCGSGQGGRVWFLAGAFTTEPIDRHCAVPAGRPLLLPILNMFYGAFLTDPPETRTEAFLRAQVECIADAALEVSIDGVAISNPQQYLERSVLFDVQLPEDNIFGVGEDIIPELRLSPSVDAGYYLLVTPRTPGTHTLKWKGSSSACGFSQDVTYQLTVK